MLDCYPASSSAVYSSFTMKVPYTQQFSPQVTPLSTLLPILRTNAGNAANMKNAISSAFFAKSADPKKMAGNTLIALRYCGILDSVSKLTDLGQQLIDHQKDLDEAHKILARHFLINLDGMNIVETLREMNSAGIKIELKSLPAELRQRGFDVLDSSSDLSGLFGWLRQANVLKNYTINPTIYYSLIGTSAVTLDGLKDLNGEQLHFLKAMVALNVQDWTPYPAVIKYAKERYFGEVQYNEKMIVKEIIEPLEAKGFIQFKKREKKDKTTPTGRGGKPADVKPTDKFEKEIADPLLTVLYRAAGFADLRRIRSMPLANIVADIRQTRNTDLQGKSLEYLAIRLCQLLDLQFMGWRETDVKIAGGGEVDAMLYSSRLVYSRWQIQCKVGKISAEAVMKEVGLQKVSRFPQALPEWFINFLTRPGDVVLDPFAGSNVTGAAAEKLGRRWMGIEIDPEYVRASEFRFEEQSEHPPETEKRVSPSNKQLPPLLDYSERPLA